MEQILSAIENHPWSFVGLSVVVWVCLDVVCACVLNCVMRFRKKKEKPALTSDQFENYQRFVKSTVDRAIRDAQREGKFDYTNPTIFGGSKDRVDI